MREVAPLACSTCYNWGIVGMPNGVVYGHHVSTFIEICGGIWIPLSFFVLAKGAFNVAPAFNSPTAQRSTPRRKAPLRRQRACPLLPLLLRASCRGFTPYAVLLLPMVRLHPYILACGSQCLQSGRLSQRNEVHFRGCRFVFVRCRNKGSQCGTIQRSHQDQRPLSQLRVLAKYQRTEAS